MTPTPTATPTTANGGHRGTAAAMVVHGGRLRHSSGGAAMVVAHGGPITAAAHSPTPSRHTAPNMVLMAMDSFCGSVQAHRLRFSL